MSNKMFDLIVLGASDEGIALTRAACRAFPDKSIAIVSRYFRPGFGDNIVDAKYHFEQFTANIVYMAYSRGLVSVSSDDNKTVLYCKNIIIATGTKPEELPNKYSNVFYNQRSLLASNPSGTLLITGESSKAIRAAIALSDKFKNIYVCSQAFVLSNDIRHSRKIKECGNISHLANCKIQQYNTTDSKTIDSVILDTYVTVPTSAILIIADRQSETDFAKPLLRYIGSDKKIITNRAGQTPVIPNVFAAGECALTEDGYKVDTSLTIDAIAKQNNWR